MFLPERVGDEGMMAVPLCVECYSLPTMVHWAKAIKILKPHVARHTFPLQPITRADFLFFGGPALMLTVAYVTLALLW